ncbi:MAG: hypothetical protein K2I73_06160, partial [Eubacterium sp.]|nr:hypothetical protein [Eubacterium sp.]
ITDEFSSEVFPFVAAVLGFEAFILAASMFRGIYSKRASDYHFSLPVKRSIWFHANFLFGVISFAVSYAAFYIISMIVVNYNTIGDFRFVNLQAGGFLKYVLMSFAAVVVIYAVFVMCAVIAGRVWQYILLSFISSAVFYVGILGFICYMNTIYGAWINLSEAYTFSALNLLFTDVTNALIWKHLISAAVQLAVFYAAGYFSFKKRKAEVAESRLSGKVLPLVLTGICFLAEIFVCLGLGNEISFSGRIMAAVFFVVLTGVVLSAIFFRKAMSKPVLASIAGALAVSAVCVLSVQLIPEKTFVYTIPEKEDIKSVTICNYGNRGSSSIIDVLYGIGYLDTTGYYGNYSFDFSSDEAKDKILQLHNKLLADETREHIYSEEYYSKGNTSFGIEYKLENGKTFKRFYDVSTTDILDAYVDLLKTDEGINQLSIFDIRFKPENILFVTVEDLASAESERWDVINEASYKNTAFFENIDISKLYECIKKDLKNIDSYSFVRDTDMYINTGYEEYDAETIEALEDTQVSQNGLQLGFYKFASGIDDAEKKKLEKLSPKDMLLADYRQNLDDIYGNRWIDESYIVINTDEYKNTVSFLKEIGYKF